MNVGKHGKPLKYLWMGIFVVVFITSVTGCRQKDRNGQTISDAPDSFWQHVQMEIQEKTEVFSNDDNSYCMSMQDEEGEIIQQQPDGTLVQSHVVNQLEDIIRVTNERMY